jgi:hypothetical protein
MNSNELNIPVHLEERDGLSRKSEAVRIGVPLSRGLLTDPGQLSVTTEAGHPVAHQAAGLAFWPDRSIKWLQADILATVPAYGRTTLLVRKRSESGAATCAGAPSLRVDSHDSTIDVDTGTARFTALRRGAGLISSALVGGLEVLRNNGSRMTAVDPHGAVYELSVERMFVEEQGPVRATLVSEGRFRGRGELALQIRARSVFVAGSALVRIECQVRNPQASLHPGGLWDLGDPGSVFIKDLTLAFEPRGPAQTLRWHAESPADEHEHDAGCWSLYQDSSGGAQWQSPNHVDRSGRLTVRFRGYQVRAGPETVLHEGQRASPVVCVSDKDTWIAAAVHGFWQNFPKALRWDAGVLGIGLFPAEARGGFELQGGEQKRHSVYVEFGLTGQRNCLAKQLRPLAVWVDPVWVESSGAIPWFAAGSSGDNTQLAMYLNQIIAGGNSFIQRREIIDEYGWRNFGDLYADHEAVNHSGAQPFVSHYNNQYDFVYGAFLNFQRTGDSRWRELMEDAARHHIDIDIYHTQRDRAAFNGGLFWHTDHHKPAGMGTHRTYSRSNGQAATYGGGPSNEHDYSSGLLHYYYLTGDREAGECVRELAEWVIAMDDGKRTLLGLFDTGPTGLASKTVDMSYQGPGRGSGNSINTLLDAFALTSERRYLAKAEEILQRCIHPAQDIEALALNDPEHRWSYLVFLQVLGKYLAAKQELGELDYEFHYARASLLHFAQWIVKNEVPYKDVLHKVALPTETWPAHDVRKSHVLHVAADYASGEQRARFREKATYFFQRCLDDLLSFPTAHFTRPLVILCVHGPLHEYFHGRGADPPACEVRNYEFGQPAPFVPQRNRWKSVLAARARTTSGEVIRELKSRWHLLKLRWRRLA